MTLDNELTPKSREGIKSRLIKVLYYLFFSFMIVWVWLRNFYIFGKSHDFSGLITLGEALLFLRTNIVICIILFLALIFEFFKPIYLNKPLKIFSLITIIVCLYITFGPLKSFIMEGLKEFR